MCPLFRNRYNTGSVRYRGYDYSSPGKYFITICTKGKTPYFGKIKNGRMNLSAIGEIAEKLWNDIPIHYPMVELDKFIIMPDHLHGIIIINRPSKSVDQPVHKTSKGVFPGSDSENGNFFPICTGVPANPDSREPIPEMPPKWFTMDKSLTNGAQLPTSKNPYWKPNSIGSIINHYKRSCTIIIKSQGINFAWQPRFYDRIIRTRIELYATRKYIINNPRKKSK